MLGSIYGMQFNVFANFWLWEEYARIVYISLRQGEESGGEADQERAGCQGCLPHPGELVTRLSSTSSLRHAGQKRRGFIIIMTDEKA